MSIPKYSLPATLFTLVVVLSGCATFGTNETARTIPPGKFAFGGAVTPVFVARGTDERTSFIFFPFPELYGKLGVSDKFEVGMRWGFGPGATFTCKYWFARGMLDAAFAGYGSFYGMSDGRFMYGVYSISPRVILSNEAKGSFPYAVNTGIQFAGVTAGEIGSTVSGSALSVVAGAGLPFRLGSERSLRVMPELSLSLPLLTTLDLGSYGGSSQSLLGSFTVCVGIGLGSVPQHYDMR